MAADVPGVGARRQAAPLPTKVVSLSGLAPCPPQPLECPAGAVQDRVSVAEVRRGH